MYEGLETTAHVHSQDGKIGPIKIVEDKGNNNYVVECGGIHCTAIFNPFVCQYYADDKYGVLPDYAPKDIGSQRKPPVKKTGDFIR